VECEEVMIAADKRFAVHEGSPPFMYGMHRRFNARQCDDGYKLSYGLICSHYGIGIASIGFPVAISTFPLKEVGRKNATRII